MSERPMLVTGATGNAGSRLVEARTSAVRRSGQWRGIRAAQQKFDAARVSVVVAEFDDAQSIAAALTGR
jgi:uncharacterized protein YbjT (DUF2867 family)